MSEKIEKEKNDKRFNFAISQRLLNQIEEYRKTLDKVPPTAEVVRNLIEYALSHKSQEQPRQ